MTSKGLNSQNTLHWQANSIYPNTKKVGFLLSFVVKCHLRQLRRSRVHLCHLFSYERQHPVWLSFYCWRSISLVVNTRRCHTETMAATLWNKKIQKIALEPTYTNPSLSKQLPERNSNLPLLWSVIFQDTHPDTKRLQADIVFSLEQWWGSGSMAVRGDYGMDGKDGPIPRLRLSPNQSWTQTSTLL